MDEKPVFEENVYYDQSEIPDKFLVTVAENISAEKCNLKGEYEFHISSENFALVDKKTNKRVYTWPFRYVRRYGKSSTNFQFEAGRKSQSGEGLFSLLANQNTCEQIFDLVQTRFVSMQKRDKQYRRGSDDQHIERKNSQTGPSPSLPARKYENNEVILSSPVTPTSPSFPTSSRKSQMKPPIMAPKPSIRKPTKPSNPAAANSLSASNAVPKSEPVNASQINTFIGQNRNIIVNTADDEDNTYSVMGRNEPTDNAAQYSSVYAQKPVPSYTMDDCTYDEVHIETKP